MNNYSQADTAFKKLIDSMKQDANTHPTIEEMAKAFDSIHDQNGTDDEDLVCIPLSRYEELLRSESEIDILCTLARDECIENRTLLAALYSIAHMREQRLDSCEVEADDE